MVGIIANPSAGKDIRRLVARNRLVPNHEIDAALLETAHWGIFVDSSGEV